MASKFDKQLESILRGDVETLVDGLGNLPDDVEEHISEPEEMLPVTYENKVTKLKLSNDDLQEDYEFARSNMYGLIGRSNAALDLALKISVLSEHPRALEVAATLIKMSSDVSKELIAIHNAIEKDKGAGNDSKNPSGSYTQINNNNYYAAEMDQATQIIDDLPDDDE